MILRAALDWVGSWSMLRGHRCSYLCLHVVLLAAIATAAAHCQGYAWQSKTKSAQLALQPSNNAQAKLAVSEAADSSNRLRRIRPARGLRGRGMLG